MYKIRVIIPYFGKLPKMFKFWRQSALNNSSIDFLLLTDCSVEEDKNLKVVKMTFKDLREKIQNLFEFPIALNSPYKLCDFRGAYGEIFSEYLDEYDFWGFGDIDLIYGDIRSFITNEILQKYDVISGWGHFTLYRNNKFCNTFYKTHQDGFLYYVDVFKNPQNFVFDEYWHKGLSDLWTELYPQRIWNTKLFDDIKIPSSCFNFISVFHPEYSNNLIFRYDEGKLYRVYMKDNAICMEQTLYAHFQRRSFLKVVTNDVNNFLVVPNKILQDNGITISQLIKWGKKRDLQRKIFKKKNRLSQRIHSLKNSFYHIFFSRK